MFTKEKVLEILDRHIDHESARYHAAKEIINNKLAKGFIVTDYDWRFYGEVAGTYKKLLMCKIEILKL